MRVIPGSRGACIKPASGAHRAAHPGYCPPLYGCAFGFGAAQVLIEPGHDLDEIAGAIPVIKLMHEDSVPRVLACAGGARQAEDVSRPCHTRRGARLHGGRADLAMAHHEEEHGEGVHALLKQRLKGLRRDVASGEARTAGCYDHVDRGISDPRLYARAYLLDVIGHDRTFGKFVARL